MASLHQFARCFVRVVLAAASVCALSTPAAASVDADFNGDGVLDHVVVPRSSGTHIVVRMSGGPPQILKISRFYDRILSIVAFDVNHDGQIDLSAVSERRGLFIWVNKGKASNGRLKALKRKHRTGGFTLTVGGPLAAKSPTVYEKPGSAGTDDERDRTAQLNRYSPGKSESAQEAMRPASLPALSHDSGGPSLSRAPPVLIR